METQAKVLVPLKEKKWLVFDGEKNKNFKTAGDVADFFEESREKGITLLGIMGGPGQSLFVRASRLGIPVSRIPRYKLQEEANIAPKAKTEEIAQAVFKVWRNKKEVFYPLGRIDETMALVRQLTRVRLSIQDFRKPAQLQLYSVLRELRLILPPEAETTVVLIEKSVKELFRDPKILAQTEQSLSHLEAVLPDGERERVMAVTRHFANPRFILGAKEDEEALESQISKLVKNFPIWEWIRSAADSSLPQIKGLGPSLGGTIISEIADISRFPDRNSLRAYARFHISEGGVFPRRKAGEISSWNMYLNRAVWLWSTSQMPRYEHIWRDILYVWKKAKEFKAHPEVQPREVIDRRGRKRTVYDFTLKHLDTRAKRWVGSQFLNYLWDLWSGLHWGNDPELWYSSSSWPSYFNRLKTEIEKEDMLEFLQLEISKRKRAEPKEEEEEEEM